MLLQPRNFLPAAACIVLFVIMGRFSLRILSQLPDFPAKRQMMWGARWFWLVMLAMIALAFLATYVGLTRTDYLISSMIAGKLVLDAGLASAHLYRRQGNGMFLSMQALGARLRAKPFDALKWIEKVEIRWARRWWVRGWVIGVCGFALAVDAYLILGFTYPLDVSFGTMDRAQRIADEVARCVGDDLGLPQVQGVEGYAPRSAFDTPEEFGNLRAVRASVVHAAAVIRGARPVDGSVTGEYVLFVKIAADTEKPEAEELLGRAQGVLATQSESHRWRISVYNRESEVSVTGLYPVQ